MHFINVIRVHPHAVFSSLVAATKSPIYIIDFNLKFILLPCASSDDDNDFHFPAPAPAPARDLLLLLFLPAVLWGNRTDSVPFVSVWHFQRRLALMGNGRCRLSIVDVIKYLWIKWKIIKQISPTMWWRDVMEHQPLIVVGTKANNFNWTEQCCWKYGFLGMQHKGKIILSYFA